MGHLTKYLNATPQPLIPFTSLAPAMPAPLSPTNRAEAPDETDQSTMDTPDPMVVFTKAKKRLPDASQFGLVENDGQNGSLDLCRLIPPIIVIKPS